MTQPETEDRARRPIHWDDSLREVLLKMAEDEPGAMRVLLKILGKRGYGGLSLLLQMDDMNIRGKQIWVGYRYHCDADLDRFVQCIKERDPEMIETINREGRRGLYLHEASPLSGQRRFLGKTEA